MNDRADLALLVDADGLHLGQDDLSVADARRLLGARQLGVSTHDIQQATQAERDGADLIGFGPVFDTFTKERPDPKTELEYSDPFTLVVAVALIVAAVLLSVSGGGPQLAPTSHSYRS